MHSSWDFVNALILAALPEFAQVKEGRWVRTGEISNSPRPEIPF